MSGTARGAQVAQGGSAVRWPLVGVAASFRLLMGSMVTAPIAMVVADHVGEHPRSDAVLFERGGYWLVEVGRLARESLGRPLLTGGGAGVLLILVWVYFAGLLLAHADDREVGVAVLIHRTTRAYGRLVLLYGVTLVVQAAVMVGAAMLARKLASPDPTGDLWRAGILFGGVVLTFLLAIGHDVARHIAMSRSLGWDLMSRTFDRLSRRSLGLLYAASWRALSALGLLVGVLIVGSQAVPGSGSGVALAWGAQWLAIVGYVGFRLSWFDYLARAD